MQLRWCIGSAFELHVAHHLQLVLVDVGVDDLVVSLSRLLAGDLRHQLEKRKHLHLVEVLPKRHVAGALIGGQVETIIQQGEGVGVHAGAQAAQVELTRVVEAEYLRAIIDAVGKVVDDLAQLVDAAAVGFSPAASLHAVDPAHVVLALATGVVQPRLVVIGVGIPGFGSQGAKVSGVAVAAQIADQLRVGGLPVALARGDQGELVVSHVVCQIGIDDRQAALAGAPVLDPLAFMNDALAKIQILFHAVCLCRV